VSHAVFNKQDSIVVVLENFYTSATGQQSNPSTGRNPRGESVRMSIAETIRSLGVSWIRVVNPYKVGETLKTVREAMTTAAGGLKVIIARGECQLERQRRVKPQTAARLKAGGRVEAPRFGVDPDVHRRQIACASTAALPHAERKRRSSSRRSVAHVDQTCVGCALRRGRSRGRPLPSFYEARVVHNPGWRERRLQAFAGG
jgi:indolepyruvate ferredoxin oxidoreductase alpha subunit